MSKIKKNKSIGIRIPEHFYNAVVSKANELNLSVSSYVITCLIYDNKNDVIKKEIDKSLARGSIAFSVYPTYEDPKANK
jgi:hypothetical protein